MVCQVILAHIWLGLVCAMARKKDLVPSGVSLGKAVAPFFADVGRK